MSDMSLHGYASHGSKNEYLGHTWAGASLFWFVVLILIVFMALVFFKPDYVMRKKDCEVTDEVDCMKALLTAVVVAIVICFLIWLIAYAFMC